MDLANQIWSSLKHNFSILNDTHKHSLHSVRTLKSFANTHPKAVEVEDWELNCLRWAWLPGGLYPFLNPKREELFVVSSFIVWWGVLFEFIWWFKRATPDKLLRAWVTDFSVEKSTIAFRLLFCFALETFRDAEIEIKKGLRKSIWAALYYALMIIECNWVFMHRIICSDNNIFQNTKWRGMTWQTALSGLITFYKPGLVCFSKSLFLYTGALRRLLLSNAPIAKS